MVIIYLPSSLCYETLIADNKFFANTQKLRINVLCSNYNFENPLKLYAGIMEFHEE